MEKLGGLVVNFERQVEGEYSTDRWLVRGESYVGN